MQLKYPPKFLDTSGLELLGQGMNGKVYRFDEDKIIKVGIRGQTLEDFQKEQELARKAFVLGLPTAIPFSVFRTPEGYGSAFEMLGSKNLAQVVSADGDTYRDAVREYVALMKTIHSVRGKAGDFPDARQQYSAYLKDIREHIPEKSYNEISDLISGVSWTDHLIHGDLNPRNVMMSPREGCCIIDVETLSLGDPVFEFAAIWASFIGFGRIMDNADRINGLPGPVRTKFCYDVMKLYYGDNAERKGYDAALIGAVRIMRWMLNHSDDREKIKKAGSIISELTAGKHI